MAADRPNKTACEIVPLTAMMKAVIIVLEWPGSSACKAPRSIAVGMNTQK
jgi:hypothetical protein